MVEAPAATARGGDIQKYKAIQCRERPVIDDRPEPERRMHHEIGDGHLAGQDKGHRAREQAHQQQQAAEDFQDAGKPEQGKGFRLAERGSAGNAKSFCMPCCMKRNAVMMRSTLSRCGDALVAVFSISFMVFSRGWLEMQVGAGPQRIRVRSPDPYRYSSTLKFSSTSQAKEPRED